VIPANDVEAAMSKRNNKPLIFIDIAVPRNVDPEVAKIPNVQLYNIDGLAPFLEKDLAPYRPQITKAERQVYSEAERFLESIRSYDANRTIKELRMIAEQIRAKELSRAMRRLGDVSCRNREIVDVLTRSIINKLLHEPTARLRQQAAKGSGGLYEAAIRELFAISEKSSQ
jgi:glutamyl-tRNA reductase